MTNSVQLPKGPARVLIMIDQPVLAEVVKLALSHGHILTRTAQNVDETLAALGAWRPHLVIVDIDLMTDPLWDHLGTAQPSASRTPVIALTRRGDLKRKLLAFEQGVDDILTVPFSPEELVARALAVMRRTYNDQVTFMPSLRLGDLEFDILNRKVTAWTSELHLTSLEMSLLYLLAANAGRLITRDEILDNLWGVDYAAESNVVDRHIRNLRAKLQNDWRQPRFIMTVPGRGYRFVPTYSGAESSGSDAATS